MHWLQHWTSWYLQQTLLSYVTRTSQFVFCIRFCAESVQPHASCLIHDSQAEHTQFTTELIIFEEMWLHMCSFHKKQHKIGPYDFKISFCFVACNNNKKSYMIFGLTWEWINVEFSFRCFFKESSSFSVHATNFFWLKMICFTLFSGLKFCK